MSDTESNEPKEYLPGAVYIRRLHKDTTEAQIWAHFEGCGTIVSIDTKSMLKGKYGFVCFEDESAVEKALALNDSVLMKEKLCIERRHKASREAFEEKCRSKENSPTKSEEEEQEKHTGSHKKKHPHKKDDEVVDGPPAPPPYVPPPGTYFNTYAAFMMGAGTGYNPAHYYGISNASQDATQYATVEENIPVILVYGKPCAGCSTLAKVFAEDQRSVLLSAQSATKDPMPWVYMSNILTRFQQTVAVAPRPIHGLVIDWPLRSKLELAFLIHWLRHHGTPLNAAYYVDDHGGAVKRAMESAASEPEYRDYLSIKFDRAASTIAELRQFFTEEDIDFTVDNYEQQPLEKVVAQFRHLLVQCRSHKRERPVHVPIVAPTHLFHPVLNCDEYRTAMEALCELVGNNRKAVVPIPSADGVEKVTEELWNGILSTPSAEGGPALPVIRAELGAPGLFFYRLQEKGKGKEKVSRFYFIPRGQAVIYCLPPGYWRFGPVIGHCVLAGTFHAKERNSKQYLFFEDVLVWENQPLFGRRYEVRTQHLNRATLAGGASPGKKFMQVASFLSSPTFPAHNPNQERIYCLIHKAIPLQQLASIVTDEKLFADVKESFTYKLAKEEALIMFDAAAPTSLFSHSIYHSFREAKRHTATLRLGEKVRLTATHVTYVLLAFFSYQTSGGQVKPLEMVDNTVDIPVSEAGNVATGAQVVVCRLNNQWVLVNSRAEKAHPDSWLLLSRSGMLDPHRLETTEDWFHYIARMAPTLPSSTIQQLLEKFPSLPLSTSGKRRVPEATKKAQTTAGTPPKEDGKKDGKSYAKAARTGRRKSGGNKDSAAKKE